MGERTKPSAARLLELHACLIDRDGEALGTIWAELWRPLCRRLQRKFPRALAGLAEEAASDAIRTYAANPQAFDAARQVPLDTFVYGIAARILRDRLRSEERRAARESDWSERAYQTDGGEADAFSGFRTQELRRALRVVCNPTELAAMEVWLSEDDTDAVAVSLGVSHLPTPARRSAMKLLIRSVIKRLRRRFGVVLSRGCAGERRRRPAS